MKISRLSIVAFTLIIIVVASAGCSSKPKVGSIVSSSSVFSTDYKWVEYQMSDNSNLKIERSTDNYQGSPAIHEKFTFMSNSIISEVDDVYYDTTMKNILGGTKTMPDAYGQSFTQDISSFELSYTGLLDFSKDIILTYEGESSESITVPAGTYSNTDLYTNSDSGVTSYYWMASGIPVPVKTQTSGSSMSLVGWG
jgi:hypothetical protein